MLLLYGIVLTSAVFNVKNNNEISPIIKAKALSLGFHKVGIAAIESLPTPSELQQSQRLQQWLDRGFHADLAWMDNPKRQDIRQVMPQVRSVISLALNYYTPHAHSPDPQVSKISRYGWGRDYHRILHKYLKQLSQWMQQEWPTHQVRFYADTGPIQDKVWAERSGLGWIAKNSNLITREYGSWVFLGSVLTDLALTPDVPFATDHCGTCTRCLEACPTQAIVEPFVVDANRCLAYHTIENRAETLPQWIAENLNGWVAGCDICQDVCPWNQRFAKPTTITEFEPYPDNRAPLRAELAALTEDQWNQRFPASALRRIKPKMWRRNAQAGIQPYPFDSMR